MFVLMIYVQVNIFSVMSGSFPFFPCLNQYYAEDKVSCSRTQNSASDESPTSTPLTPSLTGLIQASLSKIQGLFKDF